MSSFRQEIAQLDKLIDKIEEFFSEVGIDECVVVSPGEFVAYARVNSRAGLQVRTRGTILPFKDLSAERKLWWIPHLILLCEEIKVRNQKQIEEARQARWSLEKVVLELPATLKNPSRGGVSESESILQIAAEVMIEGT